MLKRNRVLSEEQIKRKKLKTKEWKEKNKEKVSATTKLWREKNKEHIKEYDFNNKTKKNKQVKEWREKNKDKKRAADKKYYYSHQTKCILKTKNWIEKNKEHVRSIRNKNTKKRKETDLEFKLLSILRSRLCLELKSKNIKKTNSILDLVGCSLEELKRHIEKQFQLGMSWDNYKEKNKIWSLDHIIPCSSFNLLNPLEQKKCFHYSNLQPLWYTDNILKSNKLLTEEELLKLNPNLILTDEIRAKLQNFKEELDAGR